MTAQNLPKPCKVVTTRVFGFLRVLSKHSRESDAIVECGYFLEVFSRFITKQLAKN
jgi:hypothetical protein